MLYSRLLAPTLRETPKDAEISSHILMLRAGLIRKTGAGLYTYLPMGLKALQKVQNIVRQEMNEAGAQEILPPFVTPGELWKESGRFDIMGKEMARFKDRHENDMVLGPTHEEAFTSIVRENVKSYRDLPINLYQINTKFRDEIRPRYGVMRCREFIMKDAYSFDIDEAGLNKNYNAMRTAYRRIFKRCGLDVSPVQADTGNMGGSASEEFMVPSIIGDDEILKCNSCSYVANAERAVSKRNFVKKPDAPLKAEEVNTPHTKTIEDLCGFFNTTADQFIKSIIYKADGQPIMAVIRGDFNIHEIKLKNILKCTELELADEKTIFQVTGAPVGFASPVGLKNLRIIADESVVTMVNAVSGANKKDYHLKNLNYGTDFTAETIADIHAVVSGEACPDCGQPLTSYKGIEVGHIFKLGYKYTKAMNVKVSDKDGKEIEPIMGCYGIGIGRTLASVIEQNHDDNGIIWPVSIAPFQVVIVPVNVQDEEAMKTAHELYKSLSKKYEVLMDDRDERPGVKFKDADLVGTPIRITIGKSLKEEGKLELKERAKADKELVLLADIEKRVGEIYESLMAPFRV